MNLNIGFCEIALVTSLFFFQQSWWIGVMLLSVAVIGKVLDFALEYNEKQEKAKVVKQANENLAKSLENLIETSQPKITSIYDKQAVKEKSTGISDFIFENYIDKKDKPN